MVQGTGQHFESIQSLGKAVVVMLGINAALAGISMITAFLPELEALAALAALFGALLYFLTAIPFLMFLYRANKNLHLFGVPGLTFSPGWTVGYFFIPFLNLVRVPQVVKEIWQGSSAIGGNGSLESWRAIPAPSQIVGWFVTLLLGNFIGMRAVPTTNAPLSPEQLSTFATFSALSDALLIVSAALAIFIIKGINEMQSRRLENQYDNITLRY